MPIQSLEGIFIRVTILERSIHFYSDILGLKLRGIEHWDPGRGATFYLNSENNGWPLLTLIEVDQVQAMEYAPFNLSATNVVEMHQSFKLQGAKVKEIVEWTSPWNHHIQFDVYDPDGNQINIIEIIPLEKKSTSDSNVHVFSQ